MSVLEWPAFANEIIFLFCNRSNKSENRIGSITRFESQYPDFEQTILIGADSGFILTKCGVVSVIFVAFRP